jgi:hypothetical protein
MDRKTRRVETRRALAESAAQNDGTPSWHTVAKLLGSDRTTLRRIWERMTPEERKPPPPRATMHVLPPPPPVAVALVDPIARARQILSMSADDYRAEALAEIIRERDATQGDTARAALTRAIVEFAELHRPPAPQEVDASTMGREAWEDLLRTEGRDLADRDLEVLMAVYAERHGARLVLIGRGGHRSELVGGEWVQSS